MKQDSPLNILKSEEFLKDRLARNFSGKDENSGAGAGIIHPDGELTLEHGMKTGNFSSSTLVPVGCVTKSMTATLFVIAMEDFNFTLETKICELLPANAIDGQLLYQEIAIKHLLSHSHGLDEQHILEIPLGNDNFIDTKSLLDGLAKFPPLHEPGKNFSYGNQCYWLAAAILEHLYQVDYTNLLITKLLVPLGISVDITSLQQPVCPALSEELQLSVKDLLKFLSIYIGDGATRYGFPDPSVLLQYSCELPGWSAKEKNAHCGWRSYGQDWFGHNGRIGGYMVMIRFNQREKIALAVSGTDQRSSDTTYRALFADVLPEFSDREILPPPILSTEQWLAKDRDRYTGVFTNSRWELHLDYSDRQHIRLKAYDRTKQIDLKSPTLKRFLKPAEREIFFAVPSDPIHFPFLQFISNDELEPGIDYIWNGSFLWKKSSL